MSKKFATLDSLKGADGEDGHGTGSESDEDDPNKRRQPFYVGGGERSFSGQEVLGPPKGDKTEKGAEMTQKVFEAAKRHGATVDAGETSGSAGASDLHFRKVGYRVGGPTSDSADLEVVAEKGPSSPKESAEEEEVKVSLTFWRDGVSIDDGALMPFDSEECRATVESVSRGRIPEQLLRLHPGKNIDLKMIDKRTDEYRPPPKAVKPFTGSGQRLGGLVPSLGQTATPENGSAAPSSSSSNVSAARNESTVAGFDANRPTARVQVRLAKSGQMIVALNADSTVADLRRHICSVHKEYECTPFVLMTTFPHSVIEDECQTINEANLNGAVVIQKLQ